MRGGPGEEVGQLSTLSFSTTVVDTGIRGYLCVPCIGLHHSPHLRIA